MAYSESSLKTQWIPQIRFPDGDQINLVSVRAAIQEQADRAGIPVAFKEDLLKVGSILSREREDVLIMYNPQHAHDYLNFLVRVQHQGKYAFLYVYNMGGSKNFSDINYAEISGTLANIQKAVNIFKGTKTKVLAEENYYTILRDCLENVVS